MCKHAQPALCESRLVQTCTASDVRVLARTNMHSQLVCVLRCLLGEVKAICSRLGFSERWLTHSHQTPHHPSHVSLSSVSCRPTGRSHGVMFAASIAACWSLLFLVTAPLDMLHLCLDAMLWWCRTDRHHPTCPKLEACFCFFVFPAIPGPKLEACRASPPLRIVHKACVGGLNVCLACVCCNIRRVS